MELAIDKNAKETLLSQLCRKLVADIQNGILKPGKRIPGDRALAKKYDISRGTVIEALSVLEEQHYIERIPSRGSFVTDDALSQISAIKIAFPCPEKSLTEAELGHMENWAAVSDAYRGLVSKAKSFNAEITFMHFEEPEDEASLARYLKKIDTFDGIVFVGHQLETFRKAVIAKNKPCVIINHYPELDAGCPMIIPDVDKGFEELFRHISLNGYKKIRILTPKLNPKESMTELKLKKLHKYASENGLAFEKDGILQIDENSPDELKKILSPDSFRKGKDAVFFNHTDFAVPFYEFCNDNGLQIGKDVGAFGYATGITFQGLVPPLTYSRINHFNIGEAACELLVRKIRSIRDVPALTRVPNCLIIGKSI